MRNIDLIREVTTAAAGNWPYVLWLACLSTFLIHRAAMPPALHVVGRIASGSMITGAAALSATSAALATA